MATVQLSTFLEQHINIELDAPETGADDMNTLALVGQLVRAMVGSSR